MLTKNQTVKQLRDFMVEIIKNKKPETTQQLIKLVQHQYGLPEKEIAGILFQLESEKQIRFARKETLAPAAVGAYLFSSQSAWYWVTITLAVAAAIAVFTVPENAYPMACARIALGLVFVLFLPGFALVKALYSAKVAVETYSKKLDAIERGALSFGLSLALVPIVGLILNYTPWGMRLTPITVGLLALTAVFATVAFVREQQAKTASK